MKVRKTSILCILLALALSLTGCGTALYEMTDEEEQAIVLYAAKFVSQYNRAQDRGYCFVSSWEDALVEEAEEEQPELDEAVEEGELSAEGDGVSQEAEANNSVTMTEALSVEDLSCTYAGYEFTDSYITSDVAIADADTGYTYLVVRFELTNSSSEDRVVNLLTAGNIYTLVVNGSTELDNYSTLSMEDLSTYYNSNFEAGSTDSVVLLFVAPTSLDGSVTSLSLNITRGERSYQVTL